MISAFGVVHKAEGFKRDKQLSAAETTTIAGGTAAAGTGAVLGGTKIPEHSHYDKKTRKKIHRLNDQSKTAVPGRPGEHDVPTKWLTEKNPRKLGARKQQRSYVAAMAKERPVESYNPVPVTRYQGKGNPVIQRDNAHSVMAHNMKGRKTVRIKVEDAPGHRPTRRTGEEVVRRGQAKYQQRRVKRHTNIGEKKINDLVEAYTPKNRDKNTQKRPRGEVEESFSYSKKPYKASSLFRAGKNISQVAKADDRKRGRDVAAGGAAAGGVGVLATTPMRRTAAKVDVSGGKVSAKDATKIASPGYRPGNKKAIKTMAANLPTEQPTTVIRYKDGSVIPWDGNHRLTARVARGDKEAPVRVIQGKERPAMSVTRNAYHVGQQRLHRSRMKRGVFEPNVDPKKPNYTGKHTGEKKAYNKIANASGSRSAKRIDVGSTKAGSGPTKAMLRTRQGATVAAGGALLGTAGLLARDKKKP